METDDGKGLYKSQSTLCNYGKTTYFLGDRNKDRLHIVVFAVRLKESIINDEVFEQNEIYKVL